MMKREKMRYLSIILSLLINPFFNILIAQENNNLATTAQGKLSLVSFKALFSGEFSPSNIARKIKEQLTSSGFTQFVKYYGAYTAYSALFHLTNTLVHELGHALTQLTLGYPTELFVGYPLQGHSDPLLTFSLGNLTIYFFPLIVGGGHIPDMRVYEKKSYAFSTLLGGPLAGAIHAYFTAITIEIFNQIPLKNSLRKAIFEGIRSPLIAGGFIIDYYQQWIISIKNDLKNKHFLLKPFYFLKAFISPGNPSFLRLAQASALYGIFFNLYQLIPFSINNRLSSDGYKIAQLVFNMSISPQLGNFLYRLTILINYTPIFIGISKGLFGNFDAHLLQNYLFAYMTSITHRAITFLENAKQIIKNVAKTFSAIKFTYFWQRRRRLEQLALNDLLIIFSA